MSLRNLQQNMASYLLSGTADIHSRVRGDATSRLAVYHNAYRMQLLACLRDTFEKTWSWLGDEAFDQAGGRYIEAHAPSDWTLDKYGSQFAGAMAHYYPGDPEVAELAWLDWHLRRAFDGPDAAVLTNDALRNIDWDQAVLRLVPTLHMRFISTNCAAIWTALARNETPPATNKLHERAALRVWRQDLNPRFRSIDTLEQHALSMAGKGATFTRICAELAQGPDEEATAAIAGQYLLSWIQDGLLASTTGTGAR